MWKERERYVEIQREKKRYVESERQDYTKRRENRESLKLERERDTLREREVYKKITRGDWEERQRHIERERESKAHKTCFHLKPNFSRSSEFKTVASRFYGNSENINKTRTTGYNA